MTATRERPVQQPARKQRWGWVLAVVLLSALALTVSGVFPFRQLLEQRQQVEQGREQLAALQEENQRLEEDVAALYTDEEIERIARDQYGLVRPGETGFVVVDPPGSGSVEETEVVPVEEEHRSWWVRLWDWVTGNDLRDDG